MPYKDALDSRADVSRASKLAGQLRVLIGRLRRRLQERSDLADLRPSQVAVLSRLERGGPSTVTTLARAEGMQPQSMGANVSALEAAGLIQRSPDPLDRRQTLLSLTRACRERIAAGRLAREDWLTSAIETQLSTKEQEELARAIRSLSRLANDPS